MGAEQFSTTARGKTAQEAFDDAREKAWYDHGHAGYTGTIAEKPGFTMALVQRIEQQDAEQLADDVASGDGSKLVRKDTYQRLCKAYEDKWGPALCIQTGPEEFLFFRIASS